MYHKIILNLIRFTSYIGIISTVFRQTVYNLYNLYSERHTVSNDNTRSRAHALECLAVAVLYMSTTWIHNAQLQTPTTWMYNLLATDPIPRSLPLASLIQNLSPQNFTILPFAMTAQTENRLEVSFGTYNTLQVTSPCSQRTTYPCAD